MAKAKKVSGGDFHEHWSIHCPGCNAHHTMNVKGDGAWGFNFDPEKPTFTPSIRAFYIDSETKQQVTTCHSFVTDGRIQFLGDCTHALAGQTVDLLDFVERPSHG